jgi:hypothetical protein
MLSLIVICTALLLMVSVCSFAAEFHVAPDGRDSNPGTEERPFATPEAARDAIRSLKRRKAAAALRGGVVVCFRGGIYERTGTFKLEKQDSGTAGSPIVYRSCRGETARLVGGRKIPGEAFVPVTDKSILARIISPQARKKVMQVDLRKLGITDYGQMAMRGFGWSATAHMELFFDGVPMQLARYPNEGQFMRVGKHVSMRAIRYTGSRPARWAKAPDVWYHGYWKWIWADQCAPGGRIDPATKTIKLKAPLGWRCEKGKPFYAINLLEEIDTPGEWYLDRRKGVLYFWPPSDPKRADICISVLAEDLLTVADASHIRFQGISFEVVRGRLVRVAGGDDIVLAGCTLRNAGTSAANIAGRRCGLERCEVAHTGDSGVVLSGGDRPKLKPGENFVRNCHIHNFGRWRKTYTPAVAFEGVGHTIAHNHFHDGPHAAILFGGNDHLVEYNHIHDVGKFASNGGAIYTGLGWDQRGNVIRHNFIHDLRGKIPGGDYGVMGIYLDDCNSGNTVHGNILCDVVGYGILVGGGRDNIITNNILVRCTEAFAVDSRGIERINNNPGSHWNMLDWMKRVGIEYRKEPWASAYPALARIPDSWEEIEKGKWRYPEGNVFSRNLGWGNGKFILTNDNKGTGTLNKFAEMKDNLPDTNPRFVDAAAMNMNLKRTSPALKIKGFKPIPFDKIGPRESVDP